MVLKATGICKFLVRSELLCISPGIACLPGSLSMLTSTSAPHFWTCKMSAAYLPQESRTAILSIVSAARHPATDCILASSVLPVLCCHFALQNLSGVLSAREFVWWYNGHPDYAQLPIDLSTVSSVAICGLGNVAVDCARILLQSTDRLASTDIAEHALHQLRRSTVKEVHLIGRRGPVQV